MDLGTLITTATSTVAQMNEAFKAISTAKKIADAVDDAELKLTISELMMSLAQAQSSNATLMSQLHELKEQVALSEALKFDRGVYWKDGENTPFCPVCWDRDRKAIHLSTDRPGDFDPRHHCKSCKNNFPVDPTNPTPSLPEPGYTSNGPDSWMR